MKGLPNFLVIGAQKCGTTTLYDLLAQHPEVGMSPVKEPHFFDDDEIFAKGVDWYAELFSGCRDKICIGEATPHYYRSEVAARRIASCMPDARLVLIVRNPVDRAYSNYWFNVARGAERQPFDEVIRTARGRDLYVDKGYFIRYVRMYWNHFDRSQLHICRLEDLKRDLQREMATIFDFLGARCDFRVTDVASNPTRLPGSTRVTALLHAYRSVSGFLPGILRSRIREFGHRFRARHTVQGYGPMSPESRAYLTDVYRDANEELAAVLGRDLTEWVSS